MARYVVRFMKHVLGDNGHEAEICQRSMEVDAADEVCASALAIGLTVPNSMLINADEVIE